MAAPNTTTAAPNTTTAAPTCKKPNGGAGPHTPLLWRHAPTPLTEAPMGMAKALAHEAGDPIDPTPSKAADGTRLPRLWPT